MMMPGRKYSAGSGYRYGFNGKENDKDVAGEGNQYDYGFRVYNSRIGRFLSVDPLSSKFPFYTPYQFAGNKPVWAIDLDGAEELILPRWGQWTFPEGFFTLPRIPVPVQPTLPLPPFVPDGIFQPQSPTLPPSPTLPQAPGSAMKPTIGTQNLPRAQNGEIDWDGQVNDGINIGDTKTWPEPPASLGEGWEEVPLQKGMRGYDKNPNQKRLQNEKGDILRPHKVDKQHPKFHWDVKKGGNENNPWENYTPDGLMIPKGSIYGKDFNPQFIILPVIEIPSSYKPLIEKYKKELDKHNKEMKEYKDKLDEHYRRKQEYINDHPEILS